MMNFTSPAPELFFSKNDPQDPRLGEVFKFTEKASANAVAGVSLIGYPDDDGIQKNGGRVGAAEGPDQIRRWLYRMTVPSATVPALSSPAAVPFTPSPAAAPTSAKAPHSPSLFEDLGNLSDFKSQDLEARHETARAKVAHALARKQRVITLGGGHDYGYADGAAFLDAIQALAPSPDGTPPAPSHQKPLVINFDAHLDVRPTNKGINSGTPFYRLREKSKNFDMIEIGIQKQCNSPAHLRWCRENGIHVMMLDEFFGGELSLSQIFLHRFKNELHIDRPTYISVDIDGFSWAYAPGCSQSWPTGLEPKDFFPLFSLLLKNLDVKLVSIYEVSPPLDVQFGTAKLASQIAYKFIEHQLAGQS